MTKTNQQQLSDAFREIDKRDNLIELHKKGLEVEEKINKELRKELIKERRRSKFNKWIYLAIGVGGTYLVFK